MESSKIATALCNAGLSANSKAGLYLNNSNEYLIAQNAIFKIGGVPINVNYRYMAEELIYLLDNSDSEAVFYHACYSGRIKEIANSLPNIKAWIEIPDGTKSEFAAGVQKIGALNSRYKVYKNPYMTENTILLGFRGNQFLESGAVYAPYIPLIMTPLVYDPNTFTPRKGIMTRYAKKMVRPEFYGKVHVSGLTVI